MNWNFLKTNWFYLAMGVLLALYLTRKYPNLIPLDLPNKNTPAETLREGIKPGKKGAALLGFVQDEPAAVRPVPGKVKAEKAEAFLKRFAKVAVSERKQFGIPASVLLACAFVNSQAGQLETSKAAHNIFALPCSQEWEGGTTRINGKCVRKYETAWASFRDFSIHLSSQEWYGSLKKSAGKDWRKWADKLGKEDVADAKALKKVIEEYQLDELDQ